MGNARKFTPNLPKKETIKSIEYQGDKTIVYRKDGQFEIHAPMIDDQTGDVFDLDFCPLETGKLSKDILKKVQQAKKNLDDFVDFRG